MSCVNQLESYLVTSPIGGYSYGWSVSAGGALSNTTGPSTMVNWSIAGAQSLILTSTSPGGAITTCTLSVTVYPQPTPVIYSDFISDCPEGKEDPHHGNGGKEECWVVCEHSTVNYWATPVAGNSYSWVIVGGTPVTATGPTVAVTWGAAGSGTIILTETAPGGCSTTVQECITIVESPIAKFTFNGQDPSSPLKVCFGEVVYFNDLSVGGSYWLWDFGDGVTSNLQNPSHVYASPGTYNGTLTVKNECGCTDVLPFTVIVTALASPVIGCISTVCLRDCAFYSVSNVCAGGTVTWSIHGGQIINQPTPGSVNVIWDDSDGFVAANGYGEICVTVTGCPDLCDAEVCVRVPVIHQVTISGPTVVCQGDPVTYTVPAQPGINEISGTPDGVDFDWSVTGGTIISTPPYSNSVTVIWNGPTGTINLAPYENYLTNADCKFDPASLSVTVLPKFFMNPPEAEICEGDNFTFTVTGTGSFNWTVTGPGGAVGPTPGGTSFNVSPSAPGVYVVSAQSTSGAYCNVTPSSILNVLPSPPPPSGALVGETNVCLNTPYVYSLSAGAPAGTVLVWSATGGTLYGGAGPTVTVQWTGGAMSLSVKAVSTVSPFCESTPVNFTINPYVPPATFVTGAASACVDETHTYSITGLANYTNLVWSVVPATAGSVVSGHGTPSVSVLFSNTAPAIVNIVCTATVCGSDITDNFAVAVNNIPSYTISLPPSACQNDFVGMSVSPAAGISTYLWSFGDGGSSGSAAPTHAWASPGTYSVTVQMGLSICGGPTVTVGTTIQIDPVPIAYVTASNGYYICGTVTSTDLTVATQIFCNYLWSTGSTLPAITVTIPGTYTVTATDPVTGCSTVITKVVHGCPPPPTCFPVTPAWDFIPSENCDTYTFTPLPTAATFIGWDFGDLSGSSSPGVVSHPYDHPGYYQVTLLSYDPIALCTLAVVKTVSVKFVGNWLANYNCGSGSMVTTLADISEYLPGFPATTPDWYDGGYIGTGSSLPITLTPGAHSIYLEVVVAGQTCTSPTLTINVPGMPNAAFTYVAPVCEGMPVNFTNTSTGGGLTGFDWNFGDGAGSNLMNPQRSFDAVLSPYLTTLVVSSEWGCTSSATASIPVWARGADPVISIAPASPVCEGTPVTLTAAAALTAPVNFTWFNAVNPGTSLQGPSLANNYTTYISGLFGVRATDGHGCLYNVLAPNPIVVLPPPYVQILGKTDYCLNEYIYLTADVGPYNYVWTVTPPSGPSYTLTGGTMPPVYGSSVGTYVISVTITDPLTGCSNSGTINVVVHAGVTGLTISASPMCAPSTLTATSVGATSYNWSTGGIGPVTTAPQAGFYSVIASDAWGCTAQTDFELPGPPDLSNVMVGCYEFCEKVVWQAPNCSGCTYQWMLNGSPIPGETNPTITITNSGVYTVVVSNGPGCDSESEPIDISIAQNPDLCHKCEVKVLDGRFKCVGIDPGTGLPLYEFWVDVVNYGGALNGLSLFSSFGSVTLISPASGFLPGGGAATTIHGYLVWDGVTNPGCISFLGYLSADCKNQEECKFEWCGELPKCCDRDCDIRVRDVRVECIAGNLYQVTLAIENNGCDLFDMFIKTPYGIYPLTPSTLPGGAASLLTATIVGSPGSMGVTVCGRRFDGEYCCVEVKLDLPECHKEDCKVDVKTRSIRCIGKTPEGYPIYSFNIDVYGVPPGSSIYILPVQPGLVSGLSVSCAGAVCNVQGTYTDQSGKDQFCFYVLTINNSTEPPKICVGKFCFARPDCTSVPTEGSESRGNTAGAGQTDALDFYLVPNPAANEVNIAGLDPTTVVSRILVTDLIGQTWIATQPAGNSLRLDVTALPAGIYILTVSDAKGVLSSRKMTIVK
ncbi:MAG: PKD domain-containing protein [Saprospiraceae bacterium]|nr:PKD domain-containing protein [Saprospiraceae bacterium]